MAATTRSVATQLIVSDDGVSGTIPLTQSAWGIKPYRGLMGTLKVRDEVEIVITAPALALIVAGDDQSPVHPAE